MWILIFIVKQTLEGMKTNERITSRRNLIWVNLIFLVITIGCLEDQYSIDATRIIKNETSHSLVLKIFESGGIRETIQISSHNSDTAYQMCNGEKGRLIDCDIVFANVGDSVQVIFDHKRILTYCVLEEMCFVNGKNIMYLDVEGENTSGYEKVAEGVFQFSITSEEYNLARYLSK